MENYDRQQYGGGDFGEVREDAFVGPSDGQEAVLEDAGSGDWGGELLDWDSPQEEQQQEQGYVEGEYDTGFIPEGEYTPGSEYDPGFVPEVGYDPGSEYDTGSDYDTDSEYDPGFVPEGEYAPGSNYDRDFVPESGDDPEGGYDPLFTWGGFEDDVVAEVPVDASAADDGRADAAGDPEIEMYSENAGQAGVEAGVDDNDTEMLPDDGEIEMLP